MGALPLAVNVRALGVELLPSVSREKAAPLASNKTKHRHLILQRTMTSAIVHLGTSSLGGIT